jgi:hypothetical protein
MIRSSNASTTKVYGRLRAMRTSAIIKAAFLGQANRVLELAGAGHSPALMYPNSPENANIWRLCLQAVSA